MWLASLAFCVVYLLSLLVGGSWTTALLRGLAAAVVVRLVGPPLLYLLVDTVLAAVAESKVDEEADES
ncbi:MAG: hypothetical protein R3F30_09630 [Planctomycetota bacterium]